MTDTFDPQRIYFLDNTVQTYAWGSPTAIPELLGRQNPKGTPEAELWMGAHPKAPSGVRIGDRVESLKELVDDNPEAVLGRQARKRGGSTLPFLFKVLAAARALSIQAHPNLDQAREGYRRENEAGIALDAVERNYRDDNHKPEILCALSDFWGMRGFRPVESIREDLVGFRIEALDRLEKRFANVPTDRGLRAFLGTLLEMGPEEARSLSLETAERCQEKEGDRFRWIERLSREYPGDIGVLGPLFLNVVHLQPGEAIYQKAGELHAYLEGTGIELMANSDNVLRGGLTPKHIDVPELLSILVFQPSDSEVILPVTGGSCLSTYRTPTTEFRLSRVQCSEGEVFESDRGRSAEIYLCVEGSGTIRWEGPAAGTSTVRRGDSLLVPARVPSYELSGSVQLFRADVPPLSGTG